MYKTYSITVLYNYAYYEIRFKVGFATTLKVKACTILFKVMVNFILFKVMVNFKGKD